MVDWRDADGSAAGLVLLDAPGCVPTISAALLESLASSASVRAVLTHGARPLTVTRKTHAKTLPDNIRRAIRARDRRDRFPGSRRPIEHIHHTDRDGRGHHPESLIGLSAQSHRRVHRHGWAITINPDNAEVTFTRGERSWTTLPAGTRLRRPPPTRRR